MMSILRRLFDSNYHHLSEKRANEYKRLIGVRYDNAIEKYGATFFKKEEFYERYRLALKKSLDLHQFFKNETDYIEGLLKKTRGSEKGVKAKDENKSEVSVERKVEKDVEVNDRFSIFEKIYKDYAEKLKAYPKIDIHPNASEEIEYLLGCMIEFSQKTTVGFRSISRRMDRHNAAKQAIEELNYLIEDFCVFKKGELPVVFKEYLSKVRSAKGDDQLIELADISVLKIAVDILGKMKSIANDVDDVFLSRFSTMLVTYGEERVRIEKFFEDVKRDCRKILEDFRIDEF